MSSLKPKDGGAEQPPIGPTSKASSSNLLPAIGGAVLAVLIIAVGALAYFQSTGKEALETRIASLERELDNNGDRISQVDKNTTQIAADIGIVTKRLGVTSQELDQSRKIAEQLRQGQEKQRIEAEKAREELARQLETKASAADVVAVREEASTKVNQAQNLTAQLKAETDNRLTGVSTDVKTVATNLEATKADLAASRREIRDVQTNLSAEIARNSSELNSLRRKGEKDYYEFDISKTKKNVMTRVADIQVELRDTDTKKQKYNIVLQAGDKPIEKKDLLVNQPLQFMVGRENLRYEFVVNYVDKDRIRGYLSTPKDRTLSSEKPAFK